MNMLGGMVVSIQKFPDGLIWLVKICPGFCTLSAVTSILTQGCSLPDGFGDAEMCRTVTLIQLGFHPHSSPDRSCLFMVGWAILINVGSYLLLSRRIGKPAIHIDASAGDEEAFDTVLLKRGMTLSKGADFSRTISLASTGSSKSLRQLGNTGSSNYLTKSPSKVFVVNADADEKDDRNSLALEQVEDDEVRNF